MTVLPYLIPYDPKTKNTFIGTSTEKYKWNLVWKNMLGFLYLHAASLYAFTLIPYTNIRTIIFGLVFGCISGIGITAGAHRLWAHKSYKAKKPLRILLMLMQTMAFQNHIYEWVRDHRLHHKYAETDADPHNAKRGFFFSHIGWLLMRKHKDIKEKGKTLDMSDLQQDPIVMFQKKWYYYIMPILCFIIPMFVPIYCWNEDPWLAWYIASILRFTLSLNFTWLVNSAAHLWGNKPYEKNIGPTNNWKVAMGAFGEGWHNYHHVFPWDYKAAELGNYRANTTTAFIDFFAYIGWAYDLRTVSPKLIEQRAKRTGDGTHKTDKSART